MPNNTAYFLYVSNPLRRKLDTFYDALLECYNLTSSFIFIPAKQVDSEAPAEENINLFLQATPRGNDTSQNLWQLVLANTPNNVNVRIIHGKEVGIHGRH